MNQRQQYNERFGRRDGGEQYRDRGWNQENQRFGREDFGEDDTGSRYGGQNRPQSRGRDTPYAPEFYAGQNDQYGAGGQQSQYGRDQGRFGGSENYRGGEDRQNRGRGFEDRDFGWAGQQYRERDESRGGVGRPSEYQSFSGRERGFGQQEQDRYGDRGLDFRGGDFRSGGYGSTSGGYGAGSYGYGQGQGQGTQRDFGSRKGPKGYTRSDERVKDDVCERLTQSDVDVEEVSIEVKEGKVTLEGTVPERYMKHHIEDIASSCTGVKDVENRVRIGRGSQQNETGTATTSPTGSRSKREH